MTRRRVARWPHGSRRADASAAARNDRIARGLVAAAERRGIPHLLRPDVELVVDGGGKVPAPAAPLRGRDEVAAFLAGVLGPNADLAVEPVNGVPAVVIRGRDGVEGVLCLRASRDGIAEAWLILNPEKLAHWNRPRPPRDGS